jgi:hypothetical protein
MIRLEIINQLFNQLFRTLLLAITKGFIHEKSFILFRCIRFIRTVAPIVSVHSGSDLSPQTQIPGYTFGQKSVATAPYTLKDLESLKKSLLFTDEDGLFPVTTTLKPFLAKERREHSRCREDACCLGSLFYCKPFYGAIRTFAMVSSNCWIA